MYDRMAETSSVAGYLVSGKLRRCRVAGFESMVPAIPQLQRAAGERNSSGPSFVII